MRRQSGKYLPDEVWPPRAERVAPTRGRAAAKRQHVRAPVPLVTASDKFKQGLLLGNILTLQPV